VGFETFDLLLDRNTVAVHLSDHAGCIWIAGHAFDISIDMRLVSAQGCVSRIV